MRGAAAGRRSVRWVRRCLVWACGRAGAASPLFARRRHACAAGCSPACLFAAEFGCIFVGLQYTTASRMVVFIYLSPFVVATGHAFHRPQRDAWRWPQVARPGRSPSAGVAWAFAEGFTQGAPAGAGARQWLGDTLGVVAAAAVGRHHAGHPRQRGSASCRRREDACSTSSAVSGLALTSGRRGRAGQHVCPPRLSATGLGGDGASRLVVVSVSRATWCGSG